MTATATIERVRQTPEYQAAKKQLADREWRLDNLYYIQDKDGNEVIFKRNVAQMMLSGSMWYRDVIAKARQLGFSTFIAILILDDCVFRAGTVAAIIDYKLGDAKKKLAKIKFAYDRLPLKIRQTLILEKDNEEELHFSNGSKISVGTTYRGDTPHILHISEYGKISADAPEVAKAIKTGAFNAIGMNGKIYVESTAHGVGGEFYDLVQRADKAMKSGLPLTQKDFKLHFFAWWMDPDYVLPNNLVTFTQEMIEYFDGNENGPGVSHIIKERYGVSLSADQKAWYIKTHEEQGPDDMKSEFPTVVEECFHNSLEGSYFKRQLAQARVEQRIGLPLPYDPTRPVNTFWDIGMDDENCIWFHQWDGVRHRFIDFYRNSGEGLAHYVQVLRDKRERRGFIYGKHYGPHDLEVREWTSKSAEPRWKVAEGLGVKFNVVPRIEDKADAIEAARRMIGVSYFDSIHCEEGVRCLDNYRKKWNEKLSTWSSEPVHDWASHGADAYMTGAVGLIPERVDGAGRKNTHKSSSGRTPWSA